MLRRGIAASLCLVLAPLFLFGSLTAAMSATDLATGASSAPQLVSNPLNHEDSPDPGVIAVKDPEGNGTIYYLAASGTHFPLQRSRDLVHWEPTAAAILPEGRAPWARDGARNWAPEIHKVGPYYLAYYTAADKNPATGRPDPLNIGVAWSQHILGPYEHRTTPLLAAGAYGNIDATVFEEDGRLFLYWKTDGNCCGAQTQIMVQELESDGRALKADSKPQVLLESDLDWEEQLIEGPWLIRRGSWVYLFYSAARFGENYKNGVARSRSALGPFTKNPRPFLVGNSRFRAPGHGSVLAIGDRPSYVFLHHAYFYEKIRSLVLTPLSWRDDWPEVKDQVPARRVQLP